MGRGLGALRIALVAPPLVPVPPDAYGGTERVVAALADELDRRGHAVTVFAAGDSHVAGELVAVVPRAAWPAGDHDDPAPYFVVSAARAWADAGRFDVIHMHLEGHGLLLARYCPTPAVTTLHRRVDTPGMRALLATFPDVPVVAISEHQRRLAPGAGWIATIHHGLPAAGLPFSERPGSYLLLVGRLSPEKGVAEAVELARRAQLPLRIAAKASQPDELAMLDAVVRPALTSGEVEYLGEVGSVERDRLYANAFATLMLGDWPEPFGLVAIESLATGTPVLARRAGALPEIVRDGVDGFVVDTLEQACQALTRVPSLDRAQIRRGALDRFSAGRMAAAYEEVYRLVMARSAGRAPSGTGHPSPKGPARG